MTSSHEPVPTLAAVPTPPEATGARLYAERLTLAYDERVISSGLDVVIPDRSFTVIVGGNGCGKSTLLRALSRLIRPTAGAAYLDGRALASMPSKQVARKLAISMRTVRRMVAKLSEQVGASGRFELGVRAAQRGWVD